MRLQEIENYQADLPGALERAIADVPILEAALREAERGLATAETERQRWQKNFGRLNGAIPLFKEKYQSAKRRVMALEAEGGDKDTQSGWSVYRRLKNEYDQAVDSFAFLSVFPMPDTDRAYLVATIEERTAYAALLEGQACRARCGVLVATMNAQQYDPGIQLDVSASWSNAESRKAHEIMTRTIPSLREQLAAHDAQVERQRADMSNAIWN